MNQLVILTFAITMVTLTVAMEIVNREIVDKKFCINTACGSDNTECWKNTWNTGKLQLT